MKKIFAVLDFGSAEIYAVAAKWSRNGEYVPMAFCRVSSKGLRGGVIREASNATQSIEAALKRLMEKAGKKIHDVYTSISSPSMEIVRSKGALILSKYGREVVLKDIEKCVEIASTIKIPLNKEPVHRVVSDYSLDGDPGIMNPLTLEGVKLESTVNILIVNSSLIRNLSKCISLAGFIPAGFIFSGLASSYRVFNQQDAAKDVVLIDMSNDLTEMMLFSKGTLQKCKIFTIGVDDLILENGTVDTDKLSGLIRKFNNISQWDKVNSAIITGEAVLNAALIEEIDTKLPINLTAASCIIKPFEDLPPDRTGYITSLGILDYLQEKRKQKKESGNVIHKGMNRVVSFLDRYF